MKQVLFTWEEKEELPSVSSPQEGKQREISDSILSEHARWFVKLRWGVALCFLLLQLVFLADDAFLAELHLRRSGSWPSFIAVLLIAGNILVRYILPMGHKAHIKRNVDVQMIIDLTALSILVHYAGSIFSPAPALYLLHIVLACLFFSKRHSLVLTLGVIVSYNLVILLEFLGLSHKEPLFAILKVAYSSHNPMVFVFSLGISSFFVAVWYVVSKLSDTIHLREQQLVTSLDKLENLQREKEQYAMQMTHQLKSPISSVGSSLSLISGGFAGEVSDKAKELVLKSEARLKTLGKMILNVLRLSKLQANAEFKQEGFSLNTLVIEVVDSLQQLATEKSIIIEHDLESTEVWADRDQSKMLLDNLLTNAIVYSHEGGRIVLKNHMNEETSLFSIEDHGIGIPEDQLPRIFDKYFRTKEAIAYNENSTGIGMSIVKRVAQNNNVRIEVSSQRDVGTKFSLHFPIKRPF